jgi:outer membrane protein OmpA-like peptidoglycan-associated protein
MHRTDVWRMIRRRAEKAGIDASSDGQPRQPRTFDDSGVSRSFPTVGRARDRPIYFHLAFHELDVDIRHEGSRRQPTGRVRGPKVGSGLNSEEVMRDTAMRLAIGALFILAGLVGVSVAPSNAGSNSSAADCSGLVADFDRAIASKNIEAVQNAFGSIEADIVCGEKSNDFRGKMIDFEIDLATNPSTPAADRKKALERASEDTGGGGTWREAKKLGDYYASVKDDGEAFEWYEKSMSFLPVGPANANEKDLYELNHRIAAAGILASPRFAITDPLPGINEKVPLPISFYPGETRFTPAGESEVAALAAVVRNRDVPPFELVGHTAPGENSQLNMDLSLRRAEAVRDALLRGGVKARITVRGKGDTEPFDVSALVRPLSGDEAWQLDRRVEWIGSGEIK